MSDLKHLLEVTGIPESAVAEIKNKEMKEFLERPEEKTILMPMNISSFFDSRELFVLINAIGDNTYPDEIEGDTWSEKFKALFGIDPTDTVSTLAVKSLIKMGFIKKNTDFENGRKCCFNIDYETLGALSAAMNDIDERYQPGFRRFLGIRDINKLSTTDVQEYINYIEKEV